MPSEDSNLSLNKQLIGGEPIPFGFENLPLISFQPIGGNIEGFCVNSFHFLSDK